jgi:hypothetical protein
MATWLRVGSADRCAPGPADRTTLAFLGAAFGTQPFVPGAACQAARRWYAARGYPAVTPGVPLSLASWRLRLWTVWRAGLLEVRAGRYRCVARVPTTQRT